ncbi:enoyl-CoA hydratase/isomerase family protein [Devosia sp. A449]
MACLLVEDIDGVRILTLNRPEQLNAMDSELYAHLTAALKAADKDQTVKVVLIRGAGTSFCTGADTKEFAKLTSDKADLVAHRANLTYELHHSIPHMEKVVIAAVQGYAVGGGCGLATACDIAIAHKEAKLGYPEIKHGLVPAVVMANLTKQVGRKRAFEMVSTGKLIDADTAASIGLITRVASGDVFEEAHECARLLAGRVPEALAATKRLFQAVGDMPLADGLLRGRQANEEMRAYREKAVREYGLAVKESRSE